ncbi:HPr family phosphocarrier protein [Anaerotruncus colihominis]|uniref:HPr family phosphocarrier protein n=1 Tax=Anaerotruncus colihominis TaxID=169435 RepID=A0A3E3IH06_9FIRM|nr:HPr family phosphocarrier protein [Anaerotruncus colihominis]RGE66365.1 HPr family phosphocarrier protein [Anaerotruncus colihominis]
MREIKYTITDELGIHARPAGQLVKQASAFKCDIKAASPAKTVDAKRIMGVMGLAIKKGDVLTMTFDGPDEAEAAAALKAFLKENL